MNKASGWVTSAALVGVLAGCSPSSQTPVAAPPVAPQPVPLRPSSGACFELPEQVNSILRKSGLPLDSRGMRFSKPDCSDFFVAVAGFVTPAEVESLLAAEGINAKVGVVPPPHLRPTPPAAGPLQLRLPGRLSAKSGGVLEVPLTVFNAGGSGELTWGEDAYDYELLDIAGRAVNYRGATTYILPGYLLNCPASSNCTLNRPLFTVPLNRLTPALPLPAGDYTLRVKLHHFGWERQELDFGVFDLPVTVTP